MSKTFSEIRDAVRTSLQDAEGNYWSDAELDDYLNEGQLEYVRHTQCLRGEAPITVKESQDAYTLPEDLLEIIRVEDSQGNLIEPTTSEALQRRYGNFRARTDSTGTDPSWYYSDLDGEGTLRFHPRPNPSIEEGLVTFSSTIETQLNEALSATPKALHAFEDKLYVCDGSKLYIFDSDMILEKTIDHSGTFTFSNYGAHITVGHKGTASGDWIAYISDNASPSNIYTIVIETGAIALLGTASGRVDYIWPEPTSFLALNIGGDNFFTSVTSYSESAGPTSVGAAYQVIPDPSNAGFFYAAYETAGLVRTTGKGATSAVIDSSACYGVAVSGTTIYYNRGGDIYSYDGTDTADTTANGYAPGSPDATPMEATRTHLYIPNSAGTTAAMGRFDINDSFAVEETIEFIGYSDISPSVQGTAMHSGELYLMPTEKVLSSGERDPGAVTTFNSIITNAEPGAVVDLVSAENDDIIVFDGENGVVVQVTQSSVGAHMWYKRKPTEGEVEIKDHRALEYYALYRAYEKDADQSNFAKSQYYLAEFKNIMARERRRAAYGYTRSKEAAKGEFF
jgi:hypothetical protein